MSVKHLVLIIVSTLIHVNRGTDHPEDFDDLIVELLEPNGKIQGHVLESAKGRDYYAFQQIPYGKPPVGEKRFEPPELHDGWHGILDCTENTKICYQFTFPMTPIEDDLQNLTKIADMDMEESEDCLYLNVYTPVKPGLNKNLSVYMYIHGGGFAIGDGTLRSLGPKYLIDGDIIVVTMNYRLGPLGFLSTEDHVISGNMGLKDQLLAIKWIYKNIHLFGGNPQDIVLGGESAGAISAGYHLLSPKTEGLVSGFIQQSGSPIAVAAFSLQPKNQAVELGRALMNSLVPESTYSLVNALKNASPEDIVRASDSMKHFEHWGFVNGIMWEPVEESYDDYEAFITSPMHEDLIQGHFNRAPCLIGFNSEELLGFISPNESALESAAALFDANPSLLINLAIEVENKTLAGETLKNTYTSSSFQEDLGAIIKFTSDVNIVRAAIRQAELLSKHVPVYLYQFSAARNINDKYPGVSHLLEMRYLWDMPPIAIDTSPVDEEVREIVLKLWWNFIKYKNPTPEKDPVLQNIEWPTVEPDSIKYLNLNRSMSIRKNPRNYNAVRDVLLKFMKHPYYVF